MELQLSTLKQLQGKASNIAITSSHTCVDLVYAYGHSQDTDSVQQYIEGDD